MNISMGKLIALIKKLGGTGSGGGGMPTGGEPHQQLVTDGEGNPVWEDRTHWEGTDVLVEFDGNTEGLETVTADGASFICLSDTLPTGLKEGEARVLLSNGYEGNVGLRPVSPYTWACGEFVLFVGEDNPFVEDGIPHAGVWLMTMDDMYVQRIWFSTVSKLPGKYLNLYRTVKPGDESILLLEGEVGYKIEGENAVYSSLSLYGQSPDSTNFTYWFVKEQPAKVVTRYKNVTSVQDFKATPTQVYVDVTGEGATAIRLRSSTPGSYKTFYITVDDNGTITAKTSLDETEE